LVDVVVVGFGGHGRLPGFVYMYIHVSSTIHTDTCRGGEMRKRRNEEELPSHPFYWSVLFSSCTWPSWTVNAECAVFDAVEEEDMLLFTCVCLMLWKTLALLLFIHVLLMVVVLHLSDSPF
jgi:hypothetical protein